MNGSLLVLGLLSPLTASAQALQPDGGFDVEAILQRLGALEAEVARLKSPAPADAVDGGTEAVPLDVSEPPFSRFDWTWMNGSNYQPSSLLRVGPVTPTFFVDADYAWQFSNPVDHTIFPTTTAAFPRAAISRTTSRATRPYSPAENTSSGPTISRR